MSDLERRALLPAGLRDVLPPLAAFEAETIERLIAHFAAYGYQRVKPPLIEFEDGLLSGAGRAMSSDTFRLMDPLSHRMMGLRADITTQIARIALTRLSKSPLPLRLSYAGEVMRIRGTQLRPEREFIQVGVELIGTDEPAADAEMIKLATDALASVGIGEMTVDVNVPPLVPALLEGARLDAETRDRLRAALDHKDAVAVAASGGPVAGQLGQLLAACGPVEPGLKILEGLKLGPAAKAEVDRLKQVIALLADLPDNVRITVDPVENRGFEYQTGVSFTIFAPGVRGELGSGGRYRATLDGTVDAEGVVLDGGQPATGVTLYIDTLMRVLRPPQQRPPVFLPLGTPIGTGARLRAEGWVTLNGLAKVADPAAEARRLGCGFVLVGDEIKPVGEA
jgi:ATP phosphoribosyltransferase regulatory subunit